MMNAGRTVFSQIIDYLPMYESRKCVDRYNGNYHTSSFTCMDQFLCMVFALMTYSENLRDIEVCLRSRKEKLYHLGIRGRISRSTLANANEKTRCFAKSILVPWIETAVSYAIRRSCWLPINHYKIIQKNYAA